MFARDLRQVKYRLDKRSYFYTHICLIQISVLSKIFGSKCEQSLKPKLPLLSTASFGLFLCFRNSYVPSSFSRRRFFFFFLSTNANALISLLSLLLSSIFEVSFGKSNDQNNKTSCTKKQEFQLSFLYIFKWESREKFVLIFTEIGLEGQSAFLRGKRLFCLITFIGLFRNLSSTWVSRQLFHHRSLT